MKRIHAEPRGDLLAICAREGFAHAVVDGIPYWDESAYYSFDPSEIDAVETATFDLAILCQELVAAAIDDERLLDRLGIDPGVRELARNSWHAREPSLYGRFDLAYDGRSPPKLLEYNADTPTTVYESSIFQWLWLEDGRRRGLLPQDADQYNSLHETLIACWRTIAPGEEVHFAAMANSEDQGTIAYLAETARAAGLATSIMTMRDIGLRASHFVDLAERRIHRLFKLYPWEWLLSDPFASNVSAMAEARFIEPPWKMVLSTKAILPLLWEMAPGHPNLLPARFEDEPHGADVGAAYVRKVCLSREGANITMIEDRKIVACTEGPYRGRAILQTTAPLPRFDGRYPVLGSWLVGNVPCGMGIREDRSPITSNTSRFVPHAIL